MKKTGRTLFFRRHIALPQEHGAWVFLLSPLLIGLFAGEKFTVASVYLIGAALAAFLLRQPVTIAVKVYTGRRARRDLPAALFWIAVYGILALITTLALVTRGFGYLLYLAVPGVAVFTWHLWLVARRAERRQAGVEVVASGVLALTAPAALWVGHGRYEPAGWGLWALLWLQAAASIVYAYLRLEQRALSGVPERTVQWQMGRRALLYTSFNLLLSIALGVLGWASRGLFLPYALQWGETLWGITHPAVGVKPTRIGLRQLAISTLFTVLFILTWR